jgi:UDP-N-acetylglucosamine acyltransferase
MHAFLGGYTVATKDVLPYSKTVGSRPACIYGVNTIGLSRRGFPEETIAALRHAFRTLLQSRLNTTDALARIESEPMIPEVRGVVEFVRAAARGVILKRAHPLHHDDE